MRRNQKRQTRVTRKGSNEHTIIKPLERLLHLYRDFYTLLRNYVMMTDFYDKETGYLPGW